VRTALHPDSVARGMSTVRQHGREMGQAIREVCDAYGELVARH